MNEKTLLGVRHDLNHVALTRGLDYRYDQHTCVNFNEDGTCACIIGHLYAHWGLTFAKAEEIGLIAGTVGHTALERLEQSEIVRIIPGVLSKRDQSVVVTLTVGYLAEVQLTQDDVDPTTKRPLRGEATSTASITASLPPLRYTWGFALTQGDIYLRKHLGVTSGTDLNKALLEV